MWCLIVSHCLPGLLGLKTLVVKMFSVTLSMAGGLIAGKEGPFIHAGGIVGGGIAGMGSRSGWLSPMCHHDKWQNCCTLSSMVCLSALCNTVVTTATCSTARCCDCQHALQQADDGSLMLEHCQLLHSW